MGEENSGVLLLDNIFSGLPASGEVVHQADEEGGVARQGVAQPEADVIHVQRQAQQHAQTDAHDDAVQNGGGKVDPVVAAAVDEGVHGRAAGAAQKQHHCYRLELHGDGHDGTFLGEQAEHQLGEQVHGSRQQGGGTQGKAEAGDHNAGHSLIFLGPHILSHHRGASGVHRVGDQVADGAQLVDDARHGRDCHAVGVDPGIDKQLGEVDGGALDGHGHAQLGERGQILQLGVEEVLERHLKAHVVAAAPQENHRAYKGEALAEYGGDGSTHGPHAKAPHQNDIHHDIHHGGQRDEHEGMLGVAHAAEHGRDHVVAVDEDQTGNTHGGIGQSLVPGGGGGVHQGEDTPTEDQAHHAEHQGAGRQEGEHGAYKGAHLFPLSRADVLGDDDLSRVGKAHGQEGQKVGHVAAHRYGGQAHRAQDTAHDDHVGHVIDHLQQIGEKQGRGKPQKLFGDIALGKVGDKTLFCHNFLL